MRPRRPMRRGQNKPKAPPAPMLLGVPSPSLAKMNRMSAAELADHIDRLNHEITALSAKIERLEKIDPKPTDRIKTLQEQIERLNVLLRLAKERFGRKG